MRQMSGGGSIIAIWVEDRAPIFFAHANDDGISAAGSALRGSFSSRIAALYANTAMTAACCTMSSRWTRSNVSMFE